MAESGAHLQDGQAHLLARLPPTSHPEPSSPSLFQDGAALAQACFGQHKGGTVQGQWTGAACNSCLVALAPTWGCHLALLHRC